MNWGKIGLFLGGTSFGSAGIRILSSRDAKKVYTHCTAAVLRVKDAAIDQVADNRQSAGNWGSIIESFGVKYI